VGQEIARFWNLGDQITHCMAPPNFSPSREGEEAVVDSLHALVFLANQAVEHVCQVSDFSGLLTIYGSQLRLRQPEVLKTLARNVEQAIHVSDIISHGVYKLQIRSKIRILQQQSATPAGASAIFAPLSCPLPPRSGSMSGRAGAMAGDRSMAFHVSRVDTAFNEPMALADFFKIVMEGLHEGVGYDRVVLAAVQNSGDSTLLRARFGVGDCNDEILALFGLDLSQPQRGISCALKRCRDIVLFPHKANALPAQFQQLTQGRFVYLVPLCPKEKAMGLFYLDRRFDLPQLSQEHLQATRHLCDLAVQALQRARQSASLH